MPPTLYRNAHNQELLLSFKCPLQTGNWLNVVLWIIHSTKFFNSDGPKEGQRMNERPCFFFSSQGFRLVSICLALFLLCFELHNKWLCSSLNLSPSLFELVHNDIQFLVISPILFHSHGTSTCCYVLVPPGRYSMFRVRFSNVAGEFSSSLG